MTVAALWDTEFGAPLNVHRPCPTCGDNGEVGSHFDDVWCCLCGWRGSLTAMRAVDDAQPITARGPKAAP